jgi:hypothetical protein
MATYAEFLAENGATADEIKLLDTPVARKAFEKQAAAAAEAMRKSAEVIRQNNEWREQVETQNQTYLRERDSAKIEAAKAEAAYKKMQELGLVEVAERLEPGSVTPRSGETPAFDPKVLEPYVTRETLMQVAEREGEGIASQADIIYEHYQLFGTDPSKRPNFRELRREAVARKVPMEQVWMEKYGVQAARDAKSAESKAAYEAKIAAEAVSKYKSEHPESNPLLGPGLPSSSPFAGRVLSGADPKSQPWNRSDAEKENARVAKGLQGLEKAGLVH